MQLHDGRKLRKQTFENVTAGKVYAQLYINFWSFHREMKWGIFEVMNGKQKIVVHKFGSK